VTGTGETASPLRVAVLCAAAVVAAVAVFGLGVMVGRRSLDAVPQAAAPPSALPTESLVPQPAAPAPPAPAPAAGVAPAALAPPADPGRLTFYDRLSGKAPAEPVAVPVGQGPPASAPAPAAPAPPPPAAAVAAPVPAPAPAAPEAPAGDPVARIKKLSGKGKYAVQVAAVAQRATANEVMARLRKLGLNATLVMVTAKGKTLYRVRVGAFPDQAAAWKATDIFRGPLKMPGSIPVR
jgi:cell division septation protein DedD